MPRYPHLLLVGASAAERYTATRARTPRFLTPPRTRATHAAFLIQGLQGARQFSEQFPRQVGNGFFEAPGLTLTFESDPDFPLAFESLDLSNSKIQLLSVKEDEQRRTVASVYVPDDKVDILLRKLEAYRDFDPEQPQGRENRKLVESIANIRLATLRELWTDSPELYPTANTVITWEIWLRKGPENQPQPLDRLIEAAVNLEIEIVSNALTFVDRTVVLVRCTREALSLGSELLGIIAEARKAKVTADFFSARSSAQQHAIGDDLLNRLILPAAGSPAVGLLDTGVNHAHPLLAPVMSDADVQSLRPAQWGVHDTHRDGHGTQMAGLAIYGDLSEILDGAGPVELSHGVQSLKLIHARDPHRPDLYGTVTIEGISRLEIDAQRQRVYCMAITADARDRGRPSSWSAAIDNLACGAVNDTRRLILISAGNTGIGDRADYAAYNEAASVEDPAQAWNALTVGGYTEKALIDEVQRPGWTPLAAHGDLAPASTTSVTWPKSPKAPFKPDVVMEAGNMGRPPGGGDPDFLDELQLLTTNFRFDGEHRPFVTFHDTSASTALAARLAARTLARYPDFSPETIRGLLVHSARWTDAMILRVEDRSGALDTVRLLRTFGYGVPQPELLFYSANNNLSLIAQAAIQPFFKDRDGAVKSFEINYHALPWPRDALLALPFDTPVEMRVTLSYFVEPSPGERGWDRKYGYASHGLRFKVIRATETLEEFKLRVNAHDREEEYDEDHAGETGRWFFGVSGPTAGSIHSNIWTGTAADLANRGHIAVHPTLGWWRTRTGERRYERSAPYSLIVTVSTPSEAVDIYTPVANSIGIANPAEIEI